MIHPRRLGFRFFIHFLACFIFCCLVCTDIGAGVLDYLDSQEITVIIGETKALSTSNPREVKIGNPNLLDVAGAGKRELLLSGLAAGDTTLVVTDDFGQHKYTIKIFQEDLDKVKERVDVLLGAAGFNKLTTQIGDKERKIFLTGELALSEKNSLDSTLESLKEKIVNLIKYIDDVPSVEIDVEVLEIEKTALDNLGLGWSKSVTLSDTRLTKFLSPTHALEVLKSPFEKNTWTVTLNFLKSKNKARTLSRPKLVCLSGKEAKLLVGGERPIVKSSTTTTGSGSSTTGFEIELKEYGITLTFKPIVKENDEIQVALRTEIREIDTANALALTSTTSTPGFTTRSAQTELTVQSGQTVFLAGLIKSKHEDNRDGIAGLSSIPFFGALFRHKDLQQRDTEIVITLTPTIIRNQPLSGTFSETEVTSPRVSNSASQSRAIEQVKASMASQDDPVVNYSKLIQNIINSNIQFPQELREGKASGTVKLSLHLLSSGQLLGVVVMQSSGSRLLDEAAEYAVKKLAPFPAFPSQVQLKELWIDIPIVYETEGRT